MLFHTLCATFLLTSIILLSYALILASVPGLPRSVRVFIMHIQQTFAVELALNVYRMRIMKTRTERGRPGTEATLIPYGSKIIIIIIILYLLNQQ